MSAQRDPRVNQPPAPARAASENSDHIGHGYRHYQELRQRELAKIAERRSVAYSPTGGSSDADQRRPELEDDLVGLALSGGGIRSAVFNLGMLQALSQRGFLRSVDYLASVSGGGYIAGHLAALADDVTERQSFHDATVGERRTDNLGDGRQPAEEPEKVAHLGIDRHQQLTPNYKFRHVGNYLFSDIAGIAWRYVLYTLLTAGLFIAIAGVFASVVALAWRSLDLPPARDVIRLTGLTELGLELGIGTETPIAFLPSLIPFVALVVCAFLRAACHNWKFRRGRWFFGNACRHLLRAWGVSLLISLAVLLGNGEMTFTVSDHLTRVQENWTIPLLVLVFASLLPFLRFRSVIDSANPEAPAWKGWAAVALASFSCIAGPFFMVYWMARENVSGYANHRGPELYYSDVQGWEGFAELCSSLGLDEEARNARKVSLESRRIQHWLSGSELLGAEGWESRERLPHQSLAGAGARAEWMLKAVWPWSGTAGLEGPQRTANPIGSYLGAMKELRSNQKDLVERFNLATTSAPYAAMPSERSKTREEKLTGLLLTVAFTGKSTEPGPRTFDLVSGQEKEPSPLHRLRWSTDGALSPVRIRAALMANSREPDNLAGYWQRAMLDHIPVGTDLSSLDAIQDTVESHVRQQLDDWRPQEIARFNRLILEALFPKIIRPRTMVSTEVVPWQDQRCRLHWLGVWLLLAVPLMCFDWNGVSPLYSHYRNKLARSFVLSARRPPLEQDDGEDADVYIANLQPWSRGAPYPLFLASMHFFRQTSATQPVRRDVEPPDAASCHSFVFSPLYCGSPLTGWEATSKYCGGRLQAADAVAISGAAVTPFMVTNIGITGLMGMANLRLGQWLPVPCRPLSHKPKVRATGWRIARELVQSKLLAGSSQDALRRTNITLMADGGFHEFFGIEELLLRRCRLVMVVDAGCNNGKFEFGALADALRTLRLGFGLEFLDLDHEQPVCLERLRRDPDTAQQPLHHICFRVRYPEVFPVPDGPTEALVVYVQMSLTGDEELDLQQFRNVNPNFPDEPTTNQRYSDSQVESYRQLGFHVGETVLQAVPRDRNRLKASAREWCGWLTEGYVRSVQKLTGDTAPAAWKLNHLAPTPEALHAKLDPTELQAADDAITDYLRCIDIRREWQATLEEWLRTQKRPEHAPRTTEPWRTALRNNGWACSAIVAPKKGKAPVDRSRESANRADEIAQTVQLILACRDRALQYFPSDGHRESPTQDVFLPGGRFALCHVVLQLPRVAASLLDQSPDPNQREAQRLYIAHLIHGDLHTVGFVDVPNSPPANGAKQSPADPLHVLVEDWMWLAAQLLACQFADGPLTPMSADFLETPAPKNGRAFRHPGPLQGV